MYKNADVILQAEAAARIMAEESERRALKAAKKQVLYCRVCSIVRPSSGMQQDVLSARTWQKWVKAASAHGMHNA